MTTISELINSRPIELCSAIDKLNKEYYLYVTACLTEPNIKITVAQRRMSANGAMKLENQSSFEDVDSFLAFTGDLGEYESTPLSTIKSCEESKSFSQLCYLLKNMYEKSNHLQGIVDSYLASKNIHASFPDFYDRLTRDLLELDEIDYLIQLKEDGWFIGLFATGVLTKHLQRVSSTKPPPSTHDMDDFGV